MIQITYDRSNDDIQILHRQLPMDAFHFMPNSLTLDDMVPDTQGTSFCYFISSDNVQCFWHENSDHGLNLIMDHDALNLYIFPCFTLVVIIIT
jgi:hypothetical protein